MRLCDHLFPGMPLQHTISMVFNENFLSLAALAGDNSETVFFWTCTTEKHLVVNYSRSATNNVLHQLLPDRTQTTYNLRSRKHARQERWLLDIAHWTFGMERRTRLEVIIANVLYSKIIVSTVFSLLSTYQNFMTHHMTLPGWCSDREIALIISKST